MAFGQLLNFPSARAYVLDADFDSVVHDLATGHNLPVERADEFLHLCYAVFDNTISVSEMPGLVEQAFGVDADKAKAISADLVGQIMLPLANYLPGIELELEKLGGKVSNYPNTRVARDASTENAALKEFVTRHGFNFTENRLKRLHFLLGQFVSGQKPAEALQTFFSRPENIGGLGLSTEEAKQLVTLITPIAKTLVGSQKVEAPQRLPNNEQKRDHASIVASKGVEKLSESKVSPDSPLQVASSHELVVQPSSVVSATATPTSAPVVAKPTTLPLPVSKPISALPPKLPPAVHEPVDAAATKKAEAVKPIVAQAKDSLGTAVAVALEAAGPVLKNKKISEKVFSDIADKSIRGLRDIYQTRNLVERDYALKGADLVTFMDAIKKGTEAYHAASKVPPKPSFVSPKPPAQSADTTTKDSAVLDKRFAALTSATPGATKVVAPLPKAQVSAARTKEEELALQSKKIVQTAKPNVEKITAPAPAKAVLTVGSVPLQNSSGQKKVVDVVAANRLVGPVEQLGKMTPTEYRRLSSNADEAAQKVLDLLSSLEATSFEDRIKGIMAWRESPINQTYLQIAEEALSQGLALPEISSRRRAAGQDSLSPAEIKALALLNAKIRF